MQIQVIDTPRGSRFLWIDKDALGKPLEFTAERLFAPNQCKLERLEIHRGKQILVADGTIQWVGTHGDCPVFCNLGWLGRYRQQLNAGDFEDGDILIISPMAGRVPVTYFEKLFWLSMSAFCYEPQTNLYNQNP